MFSKIFFLLLVMAIDSIRAVIMSQIEEGVVNDLPGKTLLNIVQSITRDPEYLTLSYQQQYDVIETLIAFLLQQSERKHSIFK